MNYEIYFLNLVIIKIMVLVKKFNYEFSFFGKIICLRQRKEAEISDEVLWISENPQNLFKPQKKFALQLIVYFFIIKFQFEKYIYLNKIHTVTDTIFSI